MSETRSNTRSRRILNLLKTPRYETKGLSSFEKSSVLAKWKNIDDNSAKLKNTTSNIQQNEMIDIDQCVTEKTNESVEAWLKDVVQFSSSVERVKNCPPTRNNSPSHHQINTVEIDSEIRNSNGVCLSDLESQTLTHSARMDMYETNELYSVGQSTEETPRDNIKHVSGAGLLPITTKDVVENKGIENAVEIECQQLSSETYFIIPSTFHSKLLPSILDASANKDPGTNSRLENGEPESLSDNVTSLQPIGNTYFVNKDFAKTAVDDNDKHLTDENAYSIKLISEFGKFQPSKNDLDTSKQKQREEKRNNRKIGLNNYCRRRKTKNELVDGRERGIESSADPTNGSDSEQKTFVDSVEKKLPPNDDINISQYVTVTNNRSVGGVDFISTKMDNSYTYKLPKSDIIAHEGMSISELDNQTPARSCEINEYDKKYFCTNKQSTEIKSSDHNGNFSCAVSLPITHNNIIENNSSGNAVIINSGQLLTNIDYNVSTLLPIIHYGTENRDNGTKSTLGSAELETLTDNFIALTTMEYEDIGRIDAATLAPDDNDMHLESEDASSSNSIPEFCESPSEYHPSTTATSTTEGNNSLDTSGSTVGHKKHNEKQKNEKVTLNNTCGDKVNIPRTEKFSVSTESGIKTAKENKIVNKKKRKKELCVESTDESESEQRILVNEAKRNKVSGKRLRDKGHACLFCDKIMGNTARHYELMHKNETQVASILIMPKGSRRRRTAFEELTKTADFYHNCQVINQQEGELILVRRPSAKEKNNTSYTNYGPCPQCLGFMIKKRLWHHIKYNCKSRTRVENEKHRRTIITESNALLVGLTHTEYAPEYHESILSKFKNDEISNICKKDSTILKFGYLQFEKFGTSQCELIRQTMRQLARFLIQVQSMNSEIKSLSDCLLPSHFDLILSATKNLCGTISSRTKRPEFNVPSLALKLGHALKKCITIHRGKALREGDLRKNELYLSFLNLMEMEWSTKISSCALSTLQKRKFNHKTLLPLTEDLVALTKFLEREISKLKEKFSRHIEYKTWRNLASYTLARIILFNKKRSGEASKMTIEQYATRPTFKDQGTQELLISLSPLEKYLATTMEVVDIEGKRGQRVPVIITPDMKATIDFIIKTRSSVGVSNNNPYVFAPNNTENGHSRGHDCLRSACNEAELIHPDFITGTKLRKYIATVCQIFNLGENESDWLARHLGHDIRVHRNFYRLHENAVETTKVSRLLIAIEQGEANKYAGKSLEEINIEDLPGLEEECVGAAPSLLCDDATDTVESNGEGLLESDDEIPLSRLKRLKSSNIQETGKEHTNQKQLKKRKIVGEKKTQKKTPWTPDEIKGVLTFFKYDLKKQLLPGKEKCVECITAYPVLQRRKWADIKYYLKNYYARNQRLLTKSS